ncbi:MAG: CCA tRNA nucleotidyltransferase [Peptococcaceae bacterium]|nr:CCA tRNA nucleotidyltransferase [Peptococcaceae bacterium]
MSLDLDNPSINQTISIPLPAAVAEILQTLISHGFEAYVVGGCVRDSLLGLPVKDWDITTGAAPWDVRGCFPHNRILDYGVKHNTLAILTDIGPVEVTTYRGNRAEEQLPEKNLRQDLRRRDFTINALAYHPDHGLIDHFGGLTDLELRTLRGTEDPDARMREDPVRILRALRLAATKGFRIEPNTRDALLRRGKLLRQSAKERITAELMLFLTAPTLITFLLDYRSVLAVILPEIVPSFDFDQRTPYHCYDVWRHTAESVECAAAEAPYPLDAADIPLLRLALLFHDLGKPACWSLDSRGVGHFYGHAEVSAELTATALARLRIDNKTAAAVTTLVRYHDTPIAASPPKVLRWLRTLGPEDFCRLLHIKKADTLAHHPDCHKRLHEVAQIYETFRAVQAHDQCFTLRDLQITGDDVIAAGVPAGPGVGMVLETLLGKVIEGICTNTRKALMVELRKEMGESIPTGLR